MPIDRSSIISSIASSYRDSQAQNNSLPDDINEKISELKSELSLFKNDLGHNISADQSSHKTPVLDKFGEVLDYFSQYFKKEYGEDFNDLALKKNGLLHNDFADKFDIYADSEFFLNGLISYLAQLKIMTDQASTQDKDDNKIKENVFLLHLNDFPAHNAEFYNCVEGTSARLQQKLMQLSFKTVEENSHQNVVQQYTVELSKSVYKGSQVHIIPFINYLMGVDKNLIARSDKYYSTPHTYISTKQAWELIRDYDKNIKLDLTDKILRIYDEFTRLDVSYQSTLPNLKAKLEYEGFGNIIEGDKVFELFLKLDDDNPTNINLKEKDSFEKELENFISKNYQEAPFEKIDDITDRKNIDKIVNFIKSDKLEEREVGLNALRILAENFKNQNPILFLTILTKIGYEDGLKCNIKKENNGYEATEISDENKAFEVLINRIVDNIHRAEEEFFRFFDTNTQDEQYKENFFQYFKLAIGCDNNKLNDYLYSVSKPQISLKDRLMIAVLANNSALIDNIYQSTQETQDQSATKIVDQNNIMNLAANEGHLGVVEKLLEKGADVNCASEYGITPLYIAAYNGDSEVVEKLLEKGAEVNKADKDGATLLYIAARYGHLEVVKTLLEKGADLNKKNNNGYTPLHIAAQYNNSEVVEKLITKYEELNNHKTKGLLSFFKGGKTFKIDQVDSFGDSPLHLAAQYNSLEVVKKLLEKGADLNKKNNNGYTPLHIAAKKGQLEVVEELIVKKNNIQNNFNERKRFFLDKKNQYKKTAVSLLCNGAKPDRISFVENNDDYNKELIGRFKEIDKTEFDDGKTSRIIKNQNLDSSESKENKAKEVITEVFDYFAFSINKANERGEDPINHLSQLLKKQPPNRKNLIAKSLKLLSLEAQAQIIQEERFDLQGKFLAGFLELVNAINKKDNSNNIIKAEDLEKVIVQADKNLGIKKASNSLEVKNPKALISPIVTKPLAYMEVKSSVRTPQKKAIA